MKLITRHTDYAIRALCAMTKERQKMFSALELSKELKIPRPFLRRILQILNKKGILRSYKGQGGGFRLAVSPEKIFLVKLIEIFQGPVRLNECIFKAKICPGLETCALKRKVDAVEKFVVSELSSINIESLTR